MRFLVDAIGAALEIDPGVIDLVVWFPHLTWSQFGVATLAVLAWSWVSERLFRAARRFVGRRIMVVVRPMLIRVVSLSGLDVQWRGVSGRAIMFGRDVAAWYEAQVEVGLRAVRTQDCWQASLRAAL